MSLYHNWRFIGQGPMQISPATIYSTLSIALCYTTKTFPLPNLPHVSVTAPLCDCDRSPILPTEIQILETHFLRLNNLYFIVDLIAFLPLYQSIQSYLLTHYKVRNESSSLSSYQLYCSLKLTYSVHIQLMVILQWRCYINIYWCCI